MGDVFPAIKLISDKSFVLGKAEECRILVKPVVGPRCSDCYDTTRQDISKHWCETCKNTKIEGGYLSYNDIPVRFGNQGTQLQATQAGYELKEGISSQVQDYPIIKNEDIVIRPTGERYFVLGDVRKIQVQSLLIKQTFNVRDILVDNNQFYAL